MCIDVTFHMHVFKMKYFICYQHKDESDRKIVKLSQYYLVLVVYTVDFGSMHLMALTFSVPCKNILL
jgi:hypothetical protein